MIGTTIEEKIQSLGNKRYFSIKEVSNFCGEKNSVLRYWELEFHQLKPQKVNNQRRYQKKDIQTILIIQKLLRDDGFSIETSKKYLLNSKLYPISIQQVKPSLNNFDPQNLKDIRNSLKQILTSL